MTQPNVQGAAAKTILIVEDNDLNMKRVHALMETRGYKVLMARDGVEGLKQAREHRPDLIIMDIQLPGVSGLVVVKSIKDDENLKDIPIIAVTAFALKGDEERMRQGGCAAYLAKPISTPVFLKTVADYLA